MCRSPHHSSCDLLADLFDWYNTIKKLSLLHKPHIVVLIEKMALFSVNNTGITYSGSACFQACRSSYICYFLNLIYMAILPDKAPWQKPSIIGKFSHVLSSFGGFCVRANRCPAPRSRVLYFFVIGKKAVLTNGFIKKSSKTPKEEIKLAKLYRADYLNRKEI